MTVQMISDELLRASEYFHLAVAADKQEGMAEWEYLFTILREGFFEKDCRQLPRLTKGWHLSAAGHASVQEPEALFYLQYDNLKQAFELFEHFLAFYRQTEDTTAKAACSEG